jgi:hypothetical protein
MSDPTPAAIARRLSPAQRKALLWLPEDGSERQHKKGDPREVSFWAMGSLVWGGPRGEAVTMEAHLCRRTGADTYNGREWAPAFWRLTPLGLSVRAEVEAMQREAGA